MLTIVIAKPILTTIVNAVPTTSLGALCATSTENCGESVITTMLHTNKNIIKMGRDKLNINGEIKQQMQELNNVVNATRSLPNRWET